jgi:hypothetical protein
VELNITKFFNEAAPMDYSASAMELGQDAGLITWSHAVEDAADYNLLPTDEAREAFRQYVRGNARVLWFSKVGSENGTLTAFLDSKKQIIVTRGCFIGTLDEFEATVAAKHGDSRIGQEYRLLDQVIRLRFS